MNIPEGVKHIKIDVGLSYNAPMTQNWLENEPAGSLFVIGVEPNPAAVARLRDPLNKIQAPGHGKVLEHKWIEKGLVSILQTALAEKAAPSAKLFVTEGDEGCSSLAAPSSKKFKVGKTVSVSVTTLEAIFDTIPWSRFEYVDYIKIDAQGYDLQIIRGLGAKYLRSRVVCVTLEAEHTNYAGISGNTLANMTKFFSEHNFKRVDHLQTRDPTFVNQSLAPRLLDSLYIYQKG